MKAASATPWRFSRRAWLPIALLAGRTTPPINSLCSLTPSDGRWGFAHPEDAGEFMRRITHVVSACRVQASAIAMFGVLVLTALPVRASDSLNYTKNYFVTGDAVTAGVGLRGRGAGHTGVATATINISGLPCTGGSPAVIVPCTQTGAVPADIVA